VKHKDEVERLQVPILRKATHVVMESQYLSCVVEGGFYEGCPK